MSCTNCKGKNQNYNASDSGVEHINLIPESIQNGDFSGKTLFKIIAFFLLIIGFPLIYLVVLIMVFTNFFIPKKDAGNILNKTIETLTERYAKYKAKKFIKKREKEFKKNRDYSGESELLDIEVFTNKVDNNTKVSE